MTGDVLQPLRVCGDARALDMRLPEGVAATTTPIVQLATDSPALATAAQAGFVAMRGGGVGLRIVLPETTAPGTYEGTVDIGGREQPFVAEVYPRAELILTPGLVELAANAGGRGTARLLACNAGNLVLDLPARQNIGLFDVKGLDRSLGLTWGASAQGLERWGVLADELAASYEGHTQLVICEGAGTLSPGEERELEIEVHVRDTVPAGVSYYGHCRIAGTSLAVRLNVLRGATTKRRRPTDDKGAR